MSALPGLCGFSPVPVHSHTDYTTRYRVRGSDDDYAVHTHGNGISVLTLAPTHPIRRGNKQVESISWHGSSFNDRSQTKVTGKRKKGGITLEPNSVLCQVKCVDGTVHDIRATVHGRLLETNPVLVSQPGLLASSSSWEGYLALFALSVKHRSLLSLGDRITEGTEAERDTPERRKIDPTAEPLPQPMEEDATAPGALNNNAGSELGPDWRANLEYLKPSEYEERRAHFFLPKE